MTSLILLNTLSRLYFFSNLFSDTHIPRSLHIIQERQEHSLRTPFITVYRALISLASLSSGIFFYLDCLRKTHVSLWGFSEDHQSLRNQRPGLCHSLLLGRLTRAQGGTSPNTETGETDPHCKPHQADCPQASSENFEKDHCTKEEHVSLPVFAAETMAEPYDP